MVVVMTTTTMMMMMMMMMRRRRRGGGGGEEEEEDTEYIILSFTLYSWLHNSPVYSCSRGSRRHQNNPCKEILDCFFYAAPQSLVRRAAATKAARSSV